MDDYLKDEATLLHLLHGDNNPESPTYRPDYWHEDWLSNNYQFIIEAMLTKKQRMIMELKIENQNYEGTIPNSMVAQILKCSEKTIERDIRDLKSKLRNKMEYRVSNLKTDFIKRYKWNQRKKRNTN